MECGLVGASMAVGLFVVGVPIKMALLIGILAGIATATRVSASSYGDTCALLSSGSIVCWGDNEFGQLGNGTTTNSTTPVIVE